MKATAITIMLAGSASAQDTIFTVEFDVTTDTGEIRAEYFSDLPGATTAIGAVWSDTSFRLTGDGPIDILDYNPGYSSPIFQDPDIDGRGTEDLTFVGVQPASPLGTPDPSNPLWVADFSYQGSSDQLRMELFGQNTALFLGDPLSPFGTILRYIGVQTPPPELTWRIDIVIIPAPAALGVAPIVLVAARRRRK